MKCTYCENFFNSKYSLKVHQETAKYCLQLQGKNSKKTFTCIDCNACLSTSQRLRTHHSKCINHCVRIAVEDTKKYYVGKIENLNSNILEKNELIKDLQNKLDLRVEKELSVLEVKHTNLKNKMEKRQRKKYKPGNCIYVVSLDAYPGKYKVGKTCKFTNRMSSYSTSAPEEYNVDFILYVNKMDLVEKVVFNQLDEYRIQNNREWFAVEDVEVITRTIKEVAEMICGKGRTSTVVSHS